MWTGAAWEEDAATFYVDSGDGNAATVIYDYKNVSGGSWGSRGGGDGMEPTRLWLQTAAGELQTPAAPRLLRDPRGQGQRPGAGHRGRDLPAPAGEDLAGAGWAWGGSAPCAAPPTMRNDEDDDEECPLSPLSRLRTGSPCPWLTAPSWAPRRASSAASSLSTGLSLAG